MVMFPQMYHFWLMKIILKQNAISFVKLSPPWTDEWSRLCYLYLTPALSAGPPFLIHPFDIKIIHNINNTLSHSCFRITSWSHLVYLLILNHMTPSPKMLMNKCRHTDCNDYMNKVTSNGESLLNVLVKSIVSKQLFPSSKPSSPIPDIFDT